MTIRAVQVMVRSQWDAALASLPTAHVLQTWDWGDFKSRWGWEPTRLLFVKENQPLAAAQILKRKLSRTPLSVTYVPKGPVLDFDDPSLLVRVLSSLEQYVRQERGLFVKIDPTVWLGTGTEDAPPSPGSSAVLKILEDRGWRRSNEQIQFKNSVIIDLTPNEDQILSDMKAKTRYNIRLTRRRGVRARRGNENDLEAFYDLYYATSRRDGFLIRPSAYYLDVWAHFLRAGRAHLLLAGVGGEPVAGLILFHFGQSAWYMYGASSGQHRDLMPNHLLQWEAIRLAKHLGCTHYDMWGAPDCFVQSDPMWGVYRFKIGFGGETMRGIGAFDYPPLTGLYGAYAVAAPRVLDFMRRRRPKP